MTWLFIPSTQSHYAQEAEASTSQSELLSHRLAQSVTWRGKPAQPHLWLHRWNRGGFIQLLYGLTLPPLMQSNGVDAWISSLRATRANPTALLETKQERMTNDSSSIMSCVSLKNAGLFVYSAKTSRGMQTDSSQPSSHHWKQWAIALRQEYSARKKPSIAIGERDCSLWPTNRANDAEKRGEISNDPRNGLVGKAQNWATVTVRNYKGSSPKSITRKDGKSRMDLLDYQAEQGFFIQYPNQTIQNGETSLNQIHNTGQQSVKRKLNPFFTEALMRWPIGLSAFDTAEMELTPWLEHMRTYVLTLCNSAAQQSMQESLFE